MEGMLPRIGVDTERAAVWPSHEKQLIPLDTAETTHHGRNKKEKNGQFVCAQRMSSGIVQYSSVPEYLYIYLLHEDMHTYCARRKGVVNSGSSVEFSTVIL